MTQNTKVPVTLSTKTGLEKALKKAGIENPATVASLSISGRLADDDTKYVRENMAKTLQELDLSNASFQKNILPDGAFIDCIALTAVSFPDTIVEIAGYAFRGCIGLTSIAFPASMVTMDTWDICYDWWAFRECDGLTRIDVHPDNPVFASEDGVLLNKEKTTIIKIPNGRRGDYFVPETVIYPGGFNYCKGLISINVSENNPEYSSIDGVLFNKNKSELIGCPIGRQGNYVIPEGVVAIYSPFDDCTALTSIFIPASLIEIGYINELTLAFKPYEAFRKEEYVFFSCSGLISISVSPNNPLYASEDGVLFNKEKTELIVYPKGRQGDYVVPDGVTKVRDRAFRCCKGLTSVVFPASDAEIGSETFEDCTALTSVTFPSSATAISNGMFKGCTALTSAGIIPSSATAIGSCAFKDCSGLTEIIIPDTVAYIGSFAFQGCTGLTSFAIPAAVEKIRHWGINSVFSGCTGLSNIAVHSDNPVYASEDGVLFDKEMSGLKLYPRGRQGGYVIPASVKIIEGGAFSGCVGLTSVVIPDTVAEIADSAFKGCCGLTSVVIPASVTKIARGIFSHCTALKSVIIPDTATIIEGWAFSNCAALQSINIPNSIKVIENYAFEHCVNLKSVVIPASVAEIGDGAFGCCTGITSVTIPASVRKIGKGIFDCINLKLFELHPDNPCYVYENGVLFNKRKTVLKEIIDRQLNDYIIPNTVKRIDESAFRGCSDLKSVAIPDTVVKIGDNAFSGCSGLTSITIPVSVTKIGYCAFSGCDGLTSVFIPASVTDIHDRAFYKHIYITVHPDNPVYTSENGNLIRKDGSDYGW